MDQIVYQLLADCKFGNAGLKQLASGYNSPLRVQPTLHASLQLGSPLDQFPAVCPSSVHVRPAPQVYTLEKCRLCV